MTAMPVMLGVLCLLAIAYRYYSAFLAARVAVLDDARPTPAVEFNDGQNYHPTHKWVLFGHHFAAISGAGPLIGPVLAAQFGYMPGLLWIVIGVCLAGAVQDFLVLAASIRRRGRSLAQIAFNEIGPIAGTVAMLAILVIIVIALAGLGKVVVKALGGEEVRYPVDAVISSASPAVNLGNGLYEIPAGAGMTWNQGKSSMQFSESFRVRATGPLTNIGSGACVYPIGANTVRLVPGSAWGTFTIACTIPIALFVGLYMYRIRKGRVVEASLIGGALTLVATIVGGWVAHQSWGQTFNLSASQVTWSMAAYGFIASVLPVWVLLCPRDYLSSFLKIGTIALLVLGTIMANPRLEAPAMNSIFFHGGPTVPGSIFPFLFITIMCGAISGFHALVSSGTTPKMIKKETDARTIGYGAMLIEGLVGVVAMIAAATLPMGDYYAMNTELAKAPEFHDKFVQIGASIDHLNVYETRTQESLRGRTGGAVTLAVGMAHIFDQAANRFLAGSRTALEGLWKYWYHFAIMFEALFILTTIDTGTRIGRFLLQEAAGKFIHPKLGQTDWWPSALVSTGLVVLGWAWFMNSGAFGTIWAIFGISNQMLAVIALAVVSAYLVNQGRARYLWVTVIPLMVVMTTTSVAGVEMLITQQNTILAQIRQSPDLRNKMLLINSIIQAVGILVILLAGIVIVIASAARIWTGTNDLHRAPSSIAPASAAR